MFVIDVAPLPTDQLVSLVNRFSTPTRRAAGRDRSVVSAADGWALADVERAADELFGVFRAAPDSGEVARRLDRILQAATVHLSVDAVAGGVVRRHATPSREAIPAVAAALGLLEVVETAGVDRLGCCAASGCTDVFVDRSPRGNRRFCSTRCHTRDRVARHRRRLR